MTFQLWMWTADAGALALAVVAGIADWRRLHRRGGFDDVGWMPWRGIQVGAAFAVLVFAVLAFKVG
jgi:hypothetical protein